EKLIRMEIDAVGIPVFSFCILRCSLWAYYQQMIGIFEFYNTFFIMGMRPIKKTRTMTAGLNSTTDWKMYCKWLQLKIRSCARNEPDNKSVFLLVAIGTWDVTNMASKLMVNAAVYQETCDGLGLPMMMYVKTTFMHLLGCILAYNIT
ncbi:hypothetical protein CHS0354_028538, partial [Potamilus streckersoni]